MGAKVRAKERKKKMESRKAINEATPHTLNFGQQQIDDCVDAPHDKKSWNINLTHSILVLFFSLLNLIQFCFHHVAIINF